MPDRWVNPHGWGPQPGQPPTQPPAQPPPWGSPPPPEQPGQPAHRPPNPNPLWRRKGLWVLAGVVVAILLLASLLSKPDQTATTAAAPTAAPDTTAAVVSPPTTAPPPPSTVRKITVPRLVGMTARRARSALAGRGLRWRIHYKSTSRSPAGTVLSQSRLGGTGVDPASVVALVVAKMPPPPPTAAPPPPTAAPKNCDPAYPGECLHDGIGDYDCAGGSGNGPNYVTGPIKVRPPDPFGLDSDGDGLGCE